MLEDRLRRLANGEETTAPWREAKARIRDQIKVGSDNLSYFPRLNIPDHVQTVI